MIADFVAWLKNPFDTQNGNPSALSLFLAVGLIIVFIAVWALIFRNIREHLTG